MRRILALSTAFGCLAYGSAAFGLTVTTTNDANTLATALSSSPAITITSATFSGGTTAAGTYTNGPLGIGNGIVLSSGKSAAAVDPDDNDIAAKIMRALTAIVSDHRPGHVYGLARYHQADWDDVARRARAEIRGMRESAPNPIPSDPSSAD